MPSARAAFFMARERNELFVKAEKFLIENPDKNLGDFRKLNPGVPLLKTRQRKGQPPVVSFKGKSTDAEVKRQKKITTVDPAIKAWADRLTKEGKWPKGKSLEDFLKQEKTGETKFLKSVDRLKSKGLDVTDGHFIALGNEQKTGHPLRSKGTHGSHSYSARVPELGGTNYQRQEKYDIDPLEAKRGGVANSDLDRFSQYLTGDTGTIAKPTTQDKQRMMQGENPDKIIAQRDATNQRFQGKAKHKKHNGENGNGHNGNGKNGKNGKVNGGAFGAASKTRKADALLNIGANAATGNYAGVAVGGGALAMTAALQNRKTQKAVGKQVSKLLGKRAGRTMLKGIPGLDVLLSGQETVDYLKRGKLDQAGIAALSGAIGWIPIIGDGISASLDLTNTGIDISRLQVPTGTSKKKGIIRPKSPKTRLKF